MDFVFITDPHLTSESNVRVDEDYCLTIIKKLDFAVEKANEWDAQLLIGGDLFDKPSVADFVKTSLIGCFKKAKYVPITIRSNHDTLFNSPKMDYKTSLQVLHESGILYYMRNEFLDVEVREGQKVRITNQRPMQDCGIPQIGLFHGFLNKEDGPNTFLFTDVPQEDKCIICLGHDHVPYTPVIYHNSTIFRIGSLVRAIRNDDELRTPQLLRIRLKSDGNWTTKLYDVPCTDASLIFKEKKAKKDNIERDYTELLDNLKNTQAKDMTLVEALRLVTTPETVAFMEDILNEVNNTKASK